jgi:hypothetical protein
MALWSGAQLKAGATVHFKTFKFWTAEKCEAQEITKCLYI